MKPESGFLPYRWDTAYSEALVLYVLALGSPTFPIGAEGYKQWTLTFEWKDIYGIDYLYAGPLFIHQMSHLWIDFRGIHDDFIEKWASIISRTAAGRLTFKGSTESRTPCIFWLCTRIRKDPHFRLLSEER